MTAAQLIAEARAHGVDFVLKSDGGVTVKAGAKLPADLITVLRGAKPQVVEALRHEQARVDRWVKARLVEWNPLNCFYCHRPVTGGAPPVELINEGYLCRFHSQCLPLWRAKQETAARRALGIGR